jgi:hypothetical protein
VERNFDESLHTLFLHYSGVKHDGTLPIMDEAKENYDAVAKDPAKRKDLIDALESIHTDMQGQDSPLAKTGEAKMRVFQSERGRLGGTAWSPDNLGTRAPQPYSFNEEAYKPGAKGNAVDKETRIQLKALQGVGLDGSTMGDTQLSHAAASMGVLAGLLKVGTLGERGKRELAELAIELNKPAGWEDSIIRRVEGMEDPSKEAARWAQGAEAAERLRRLMANGVPGEYGTGDAKVARPAVNTTLKEISATASRDEMRDFIQSQAAEAFARKFHTNSDWQQLVNALDDDDSESAINLMRTIYRKTDDDQERKELKRHFAAYMNPKYLDE